MAAAGISGSTGGASRLRLREALTTDRRETCADPGAQVRLAHTVDAHDLLPRASPAHDAHARGRDAGRLRDQLAERVVGGSLDGRRGDLGPVSPVGAGDELLARGARG